MLTDILHCTANTPLDECCFSAFVDEVGLCLRLVDRIYIPSGVILRHNRWNLWPYMPDGHVHPKTFVPSARMSRINVQISAGPPVTLTVGR